MKTKRGLKAVLVLTGVLILFYIGYGLTHPARTKARAQRINAVNNVARVSMILTPTNTALPASALPMRR